MTRVSFSSIGWGDSGVTQTLDIMGSLIDGGLDSPDVVDFARALAVSAGVRNHYNQAVAIRTWLTRVWRFVDDPLDRELLQSPDKLLSDYARLGYIPGDCDEAAILGGALGKAVGLTVTLTTLAFPSDDAQGDRYQHVFASLLTDDGREVSLDVTRPRGPVPMVTRSYTVEV